MVIGYISLFILFIKAQAESLKIGEYKRLYPLKGGRYLGIYYLLFSIKTLY
jgi:hypothetical protein